MDEHFYIKTDHWALKFLTEQKVTNLLQQKWISKLMSYTYTILYRMGKDNIVADALSRILERQLPWIQLKVSSSGNHEDMVTFGGSVVRNPE